MANITAARLTPSLITPYDFYGDFVVATGTVIWQGAGLAFNASGLIVNGGTAAQTAPAGRAENSTTDANGVIGGASVAGQLMHCHFGMHLFDNGAAPCTNALRFTKCYYEDNHTVGITATGTLIAGIIWDVTSAGVWVFCSPFDRLI